MTADLDERAALEVMGWSFQTFPDGPVPHVKHWYETSPCPNNPNHPSFRGRRPYFSKDLNEAWRLVEKLSADGWKYEISNTWGVRFWKSDGLRASYSKNAGALGITEAAVRAVGGGE